MHVDEFWKIVAEVRRLEDESSFRDRLVATLSGLETEMIFAFHRAFASRVHEAYRFDLMAVASIINANATGEDYDAFVGWLIAQGRAYFEASLAEPGLAAKRAQAQQARSQALWQAPALAYRQRTGRDDFDLEADPISLVMVGHKLTAGDVQKRFPALVDRFNWEP